MLLLANSCKASFTEFPSRYLIFTYVIEIFWVHGNLLDVRNFDGLVDRRPL